MSIDEFVVKMSTSVEFETRFGDLLCESSDFCLQLSTSRFSVGDSLLHTAVFRLIFGTVLGLLGADLATERSIVVSLLAFNCTLSI